MESEDQEGEEEDEETEEEEHECADEPITKPQLCMDRVFDILQEYAQQTSNVAIETVYTQAVGYKAEEVDAAIALWIDLGMYDMDSTGTTLSFSTPPPLPD